MVEENSLEKILQSLGNIQKSQLINLLNNESSAFNSDVNHNPSVSFEKNLSKILPERISEIKNSSSIMTMPFLAKNALLDVAISSLLSLNR